MRTWLSKIPMVLLAVVSALALYFYISASSFETKLMKSEVKVESLESDLKTEQQRVKNLSILSEQLDATVKETSKRITSIEEGQSSALKEIENIISEKGNTYESNQANNRSLVNPTLDPDIARVLSDVCERVRGSPCPDP